MGKSFLVDAFPTRRYKGLYPGLYQNNVRKTGGYEARWHISTDAPWTACIQAHEKGYVSIPPLRLGEKVLHVLLLTALVRPNLLEYHRDTTLAGTKRSNYVSPFPPPPTPRTPSLSVPGG
ncbi:hypothetical protein TESG_05498 [Trichophyton tonsurans CBS 112818]|uniref:Uncharacterized protein n=1 Tax=Trichophyton tonsurans (strain CBS 112818) TaxID=647933 RepID=F2S3G1_TRIT1|nr:hypothetical protein TESG_05498 [Trichophyton tonsurans CBS 112818]